MSGVYVAAFGRMCILIAVRACSIRLIGIATRTNLIFSRYTTFFVRYSERLTNTLSKFIR